MKFYIDDGTSLREVITVSEAAARLHYRRRSIQQKCDLGQLDSVKIAGAWWIFLDQIQAKAK